MIHPSNPVTDAAALALFAFGLALLPAAIVLNLIARSLP